MIHRDIFTITSVIVPIKRPLSYSDTRSSFSHEERLNQTLHSISTIIEKMPHSEIYIFEGGYKSYEENFKNIPNIKYYYFGDRRLIRFLVDSKNKSLGEVAILLYGIYLSKISSCKFDIFFKLSGRYYLNDQFQYEGFKSEKLSFRKLGNGYSTKLYAVPYSAFYKYILYLIGILPVLLLGKSIECTLYYLILKRHINIVSELGVSGWDGTNGNIVSE